MDIKFKNGSEINSIITDSCVRGNVRTTINMKEKIFIHLDLMPFVDTDVKKPCKVACGKDYSEVARTDSESFPYLETYDLLCKDCLDILLENKEFIKICYNRDINIYQDLKKRND